MPECSCFHNYDLKRAGPSNYELAVHIEGQASFLKDILERTGLAQINSTELDIWALSLATKLTISNVRDEAQLRRFLDALCSRIFVDLTPEVEECYALAPYTVFQSDSGDRTRMGDLLYQAKYKRNNEATMTLSDELEDFIFSHPTLKNISAIVAPPKSNTSTQDLAGQWVQSIAKSHRWRPLQANKIRQTEPQKDLDGVENEEDVAARVANSMEVRSDLNRRDVLIVDDTIRSGGTMKELARALHQAGAVKVFGVSVAKDAKFTLGGIDLSKEQWS